MSTRRAWANSRNIRQIYAPGYLDLRAFVAYVRRKNRLRPDSVGIYYACRIIVSILAFRRRLIDGRVGSCRAVRCPASLDPSPINSSEFVRRPRVRQTDRSLRCPVKTALGQNDPHCCKSKRRSRTASFNGYASKPQETADDHRRDRRRPQETTEEPNIVMRNFTSQLAAREKANVGL